MTATLSRRRDAVKSIYTVRKLLDPDEIRSLLEPDKVYAAYALAQLEPRLFSQAEWRLATGSSGPALVLHSRGGLGRALFAQGDAGGIEAILSLHPGPRFSFGSLRPEHRRAFDKYFVSTRPQTMLRMSVTAPSLATAAGQAVRLGGSHAAVINRLYSIEGGTTAYSPSHIAEGAYFGVFIEGSLVSIAGTHVISPTEGVAVVGNVFTHPRYRGRGLAGIATSAATTHLLDRCPLVVLTVESGNVPAISVYRRLGYETLCTLHETPLIRKEMTGAVSLARRLLARRRGGTGEEVVVR